MHLEYRLLLNLLNQLIIALQHFVGQFIPRARADRVVENVHV